MELQNMTIRKNPAIIRQNAAKEENLVLVLVVLRMTEGMTKILHFDHIEYKLRQKTSFSFTVLQNPEKMPFPEFTLFAAWSIFNVFCLFRTEFPSDGNFQIILIIYVL